MKIVLQLHQVVGKNLNLFVIRHSLTYNFPHQTTRIKTADRWGHSPDGCRDFKDSKGFILSASPPSKVVMAVAVAVVETATMTVTVVTWSVVVAVVIPMTVVMAVVVMSTMVVVMAVVSSMMTAVVTAMISTVVATMIAGFGNSGHREAGGKG
jgi:hypothetical protein